MSTGISTSEATDMIAPALVRAVNAVEAVKKDNKGHGYMFADLASCIDEAKRVLGANGMTVLQPPAVQFVVGGDVSVDGEMQPARIVQILRTVILHESGQWIASEAIVPEGAGAPKMSVAQAIGSAITYMRRYSLCSILSIPVEDDDGVGAGNARGRQGGGYQPRDHDGGDHGGSNGYSQRDDRYPASQGRAADPDRRVAERAASQPPARRPSPPPRQGDGPPIESYTPPAGRR